MIKELNIFGDIVSTIENNIEKEIQEWVNSLNLK